MATAYHNIAPRGEKATNAKAPEQQQAEADQARQLEIKRMTIPNGRSKARRPRMVPGCERVRPASSPFSALGDASKAGVGPALWLPQTVSIATLVSVLAVPNPSRGVVGAAWKVR